MVKTPPKETILSYVCGAVFAASWWVWIDAFVWQNLTSTGDSHPPNLAHWIPAIVSTIALVLINIVSFKKMENAAMWGEEVPKGVTFWLLFCFIIAFGSIVCAIWMAVANWFTNSDLVDGTWSYYAPVALICTTLGIFFASLLYMYKSASSKSDSDF